MDDKLKKPNERTRRNVLVFPCGSEVALEIYRSLKDSIHFHLIGASSVEDHGRFVFKDYIGGLPWINSTEFIPALKEIVKGRQVEAVYPAMDMALAVIKEAEDELGCKVVTSPLETVKTCLSKSQTYATLSDVVKVPRIYSECEFSNEAIYPVFCKYDVGYGSRGAQKVMDEHSLAEYRRTHRNSIVCEYLTGDEYTVDCFTDSDGKLLFAGPRTRRRVSNGISVDTMPYDDASGEVTKNIEAINGVLRFCGAWFAQFKRDKNGALTLLEVAARLAGSSSLYRGKGINFAAMSLFAAFGASVSIVENSYAIEMDRALDNVYSIDYEYDVVYCDFDDCLILDDSQVNSDLIGFLYRCLNEGKRIVLLSRHYRDIDIDLKRFRLSGLFDKVVHITDGTPKADFIESSRSIFIDDSFSERASVHNKLGIPVFGVDMIKYL